MPGMITETSVTLLERLRNSSGEAAWREFFRRYAPMLLAFAKRLGLSDADAGDAVQETLVALHTAFASMSGPFDRSQGKFKSYLRGIAQHKVQDVRRRHARIARAERESAETQTAKPRMNDEANIAFELEWQRSLLAHALKLVAQEIDPAVYQAFELYSVHGQKPEKVASLLGVSRNAVYISKTRVLKRLKTVLAELKEAEG